MFHFFKKILKKILYFVFAILDTGVVKLHTNGNHKLWCFRLFGHNIFTSRNPIKLQENTIIYFKINRISKYSLKCIQGWINIANELGYRFIFVCDNNILRYQIYRNCYFDHLNFSFIKSKRIKLFRVKKNLYNKFWKKATIAHLTPFYCAKKANIVNHWDIDADDTLFLIDAKKGAQILKAAEKIAIEKDINAFSLDMWRSKSNGVHWSLGILFIHDTIDFMNIFKNENSLEWTEKYKDYDCAFNLDWYMSYLKKYKNIKIDTFYVENCYFIHFGELLFSLYNSWICLWKNNKIIYPILKYIYKSDIGELDIADCIKIDVNIKEEESIHFFENEVPYDRFLDPKLRQLCNMTNFAASSKNELKIK